MRNDTGKERRGDAGNCLRVSASPCLRVSRFLLLALAFCPASRAEHELPDPGFFPGSGIEMKITNFYETIPPAGFLPLRIQVTNRSNAPRQWRLTALHSLPMLRTFRYATTLEVPAEEERTFDILVPVAPQVPDSGRYSTLTIQVAGYGVDGGTSHETAGAGGRTPTRFLGLGEALSVQNWGPLKETLEKSHSRSLDGTSLDMAFMPADWRALAGFEILILTEGEWRSLPAPQRHAILDWVAQRGRLVICRETETGTESLPPPRLGTGHVEFWPSGTDLQKEIIKAVTAPERSDTELTLQYYTGRWHPAETVGRSAPPQALILIFVIAFAVVIGPVNFLVLAPAGRRHRLFWTTPLLSLAATLLMIGYIFLREGLGGEGERFLAQCSLPRERKAVLWQEQVSRTGVLVSNAFAPPEPILPAQISLRWDAGQFHGSERGNSYALEGTTWTGDWFQSRSTQAQLFTAVVSTRGRIEITAEADGTPAALSSFEHPLRDFWYFDGQNIPWRAASLAPGEKQRLQKDTVENFQAWKEKVLEPAGYVTRSRIDAFDTPSRFFAASDTLGAIPSVASIRWKKTTGVLFGEVVRRP